jgi:hypothetical protein
MNASALTSALDNLEKSWASLDWWLNFWTVLVVVGVALELVVLITEYTNDWRDFRREVIHSPEKPSLLIFCLGLLGAGMVAVGVAGEFRIHVMAGKIEADMREESRQLVAIAEREAGDAKERAGKLEKDAATIRLEADHLEESLLNTRRQLIAMSARSTLIYQGTDEFLKATRPFKGQKVELELCNGLANDNEANLLWGAISTMLSRAGWEVRSITRYSCLAGTGFGVQVSGNRSLTTEAAADSLALVLEKLLWGDLHPSEYARMLKAMEPRKDRPFRVFPVIPVMPGDPPLSADTLRVQIFGHPTI